MTIKGFTGFTLLAFFLFISSCELNNAKEESEEEQISDATPEAPFSCEEGTVNGFPCQNVALYAQLTISELSGQTSGVFLNDIWGWTDPEDGKEYALVGLTNGVSFVDISDPVNPVVVGRLPESNLNAKFKQLSLEEYPACNLGLGQTQRSKSITEGSSWRDLKVYDNHVFIVSDSQPHGMQVFDLTRLREYGGEVIEFNHDALYDEFGPSHNIVINEATGFAYAAGVTQSERGDSRQSTGLHIVDIRDPKSPVFAARYFDPETEVPSASSAGNGYIHDAQCVIYEGPDGTYINKEICFNSAEGALVIADVTDKENLETISFKSHQDMQYSHQGWLTEDQKYFLMNDELDERNLGRGTKTYIWDVRDLENPEFIGYHEHSTSSIDHNLYIKGNYVYQSNYNAGLQILDLTGVANADLERVAYFDTQPVSDQAAFQGTWSNYPFFESGLVILSDIESGLFIVRPNLD